MHMGTLSTLTCVCICIDCCSAYIRTEKGQSFVALVKSTSWPRSRWQNQQRICK